MRKDNNDQLVYAATDLSNHLACGHLTALNLDVAQGRRDAPDYRDPSLVVLQERGLEFEAQYLAQLKVNGWDVDDEQVDEGQDAQKRTIAARAGRGVIYKAVLSDGQRYGRIDFLRRVEMPSDLGGWS